MARRGRSVLRLYASSGRHFRTGNMPRWLAVQLDRPQWSMLASRGREGLLRSAGSSCSNRQRRCRYWVLCRQLTYRCEKNGLPAGNETPLSPAAACRAAWSDCLSYMRQRDAPTLRIARQMAGKTILGMHPISALSWHKIGSEGRSAYVIVADAVLQIGMPRLSLHCCSPHQ
jgi:hypothetical protein